MSQGMTSANRTEVDLADEERVMPTNLDTNATYVEDEWVAVWTVKSTRATQYAPGYGVQNKNLAEGYSDFDFQDSGTNAVSGKNRYAIYESEDRDNLIRKMKLPNCSQLRDANGSNRTEKPIIHQRSPGASQDRVLALEQKVDNSTNAGNSPSSSNSSAELGLPYASF